MLIRKIQRTDSILKINAYLYICILTYNQILMIDFPNAKINIGLNITEKRLDGFHNIETVFFPIKLNVVLSPSSSLLKSLLAPIPLGYIAKEKSTHSPANIWTHLLS